MKAIRWLISALFLLMFPAIVHAESEDILSHFQPYITLQEEYNSNIDLANNKNKRDDFITTVSPGLKFSTAPKSPVTGEFRQTPTAEEKYGVDLDVSGGFNFFAKEHERNYTSLNGLLNAWYAVIPNLNFRARDYVIRSEDIREPEYSPTSIPGEYFISRTIKRVPYFRNVFEPSVQYQFGREDVIALNYRNNVYQISSRTYQDSKENFINPKVTYWFDIRSGVSLEYGLTLGSFQRSPDLVGHMGVGRYTYRFNPKTSIFGEYTQLWRIFDNPGVDYNVYKPSIGIEQAFSPTLSGILQVGYYWAKPEGGSTFDKPFFDILVTQRAEKTTYTLALQGGYTEDFFTAENLGFVQNYRAIGRISHQLLQKMNVGLFSSYEWDKRQGPFTLAGKETDRIWAIGGNASYKLFKWLTLSLEISRRENYSNVDTANYSEYRGIFGITATYL